jgi:3-hydroxybutyrate dehydrogenase
MSSSNQLLVFQRLLTLLSRIVARAVVASEWQSRLAAERQCLPFHLHKKKKKKILRLKMRMDRLIAIVSGGGSGIGRAAARRYVKEGARVCVADINESAAHQVAQELNNKDDQDDNERAFGLRVDVTSEEDIKAAFSETRHRFNAPTNCVVSNAGVQSIAPIVEIELAQWQHMLAVHLSSSFLFTRELMRQMAEFEQREAAILYMGSVHSHEASVNKAPYVSAKHGLMGLCRTAAKEGGAAGLRANVVCPGYVYTPLVAEQIPKTAARLNITEEQVISDVMLSNTVDSQFTTVDDIAQLCVDLVKFPSAALTGQSFIASHGWVMK